MEIYARVFHEQGVSGQTLLGIRSAKYLHRASKFLLWVKF
jgi:hypothetical protein